MLKRGAGVFLPRNQRGNREDPERIERREGEHSPGEPGNRDEEETANNPFEDTRHLPRSGAGRPPEQHEAEERDGGKYRIDRHEELGSHEPFKPPAHALADHEAVLEKKDQGQESIPYDGLKGRISRAKDAERAPRREKRKQGDRTQEDRRNPNDSGQEPAPVWRC